MGLRRVWIGALVSVAGALVATSVPAVASSAVAAGPVIGMPWVVRNEPIVNTKPPYFRGEATYRRKLAAVPGQWTPEGLEFSYQWLADGEPIEGKTGKALRPGVDQLGTRISLVVTATDASGATGMAQAGTSSRVTRLPLNVRKWTTVKGVFRFSRTVRATPPKLARKARLNYRWLRDDAPIEGARSQRYRLRAADVGHEVRVRVLARRAGYYTRELESRPREVSHLRPTRKFFTYSVATRGPVNADLGIFRTQAHQTFDDPRGWRAAGIGFRRVADGGDFTLVLATAATVPSFSSACSAQWSCRVGRFVIINQTRWQTASPAWTAASRSLRDYRHLVVNHETGHWLGHDHQGCPGSGPAPVMMQQSKGTGGCSFNPWPVPSERWTSR